MAEHGLVRAYLVELRHSLEGIASEDADEIVAEVEDHLLEAVVHMTEHEALARFGTPSLIAATFRREARRGAAVPTPFTKRAGLAALVCPVLLASGAAANSATEGTLHGWAVLYEALAIPAFVWGILGLRARHGGLGGAGRLAIVMMAAAVPVSIPFAWAGPLVLGVIWSAAFAILSVGMLRARALPPVPVALFGFTWGVFWIGAWIMTLAGGDAGEYFLMPLVVVVASYAWLGWAMWREEVLATPGSGPWASAAA